MAIGTTAAILGAAAIGTAGSVASGVIGSKAASNASQAQTAAANSSIILQKQAIQQIRIDSYPWALQGAQALYKYMDELGIPRPKNPILPDLSAGPFKVLGGIPPVSKIAFTDPSGGVPAAGALGDDQIRSGFHETPGYKFAVEEGERGILSNLSALGMRNSGAALKALTRFRVGTANQEYGNYLNRLASAAGMGQTQVNQTNALTQSGAQSIGRTMENAGAARASGYVGSANAINNSIGGVTNTWGNALGRLSV